MKGYIVLIALITLGFKGFTQVAISSTSRKDEVICLCCGPTDPAKQPLWIVNGKTISQLDLSALNPNYIETMNILKDKEVLTKYGPTAKNGVIEITLKKNIKSYSVDKILAKNRIDLELRKLPIYLNNALIVGDSIYLPSNKKIRALVVDANSNAEDRSPSNSKHLVISETK